MTAQPPPDPSDAPTDERQDPPDAAGEPAAATPAPTSTAPSTAVPSTAVPSTAAAGRSRRSARRWLLPAGLVLLGLLLGAGGALLIRSGHGDEHRMGGDRGTVARGGGRDQGPGTRFGQRQRGPNQSGQLPQPDGQLPGFGRRGGFAGADVVEGTVQSVTSSSIIVSAASGNTTYRVPATARVVRDGVAVKLTDLKPSDPVRVHVYKGADGSIQVELILAGTSATQSPGRPHQ